MPRKSYVGKNRFCPKSRQTEWNYLRIFYYWLRGSTLSEMYDWMQADELFFEEVMDLLNSGFDSPVQKTDLTQISRQSLHNIINHLSDHIVDYDRRTSYYYIRKFLMNPTDDQVEKPKAAKTLLKWGTRFLPTRAIVKLAEKYFINDKAPNNGEMVWQISSGNVNNDVYRKTYKISSPESLLDNHLIRIMRK